MKVRTIIDKENGRKWDIYKGTDGLYSVIYAEYFSSCGWREMWEDINYTKEAVELWLDIKL